MRKLVTQAACVVGTFVCMMACIAPPAQAMEGTITWLTAHEGPGAGTPIFPGGCWLGEGTLTLSPPNDFPRYDCDESGSPGYVAANSKNVEGDENNDARDETYARVDGDEYCSASDPENGFTEEAERVANERLKPRGRAQQFPNEPPVPQEYQVEDATGSAVCGDWKRDARAPLYRYLCTTLPNPCFGLCGPICECTPTTPYCQCTAGGECECHPDGIWPAGCECHGPNGECKLDECDEGPCECYQANEPCWQQCFASGSCGLERTECRNPESLCENELQDGPTPPTWGLSLQRQGEERCPHECWLQHVFLPSESPSPDSPWATIFVNPKLNIEQHLILDAWEASAGGVGYVCPLLRNTEHGNMIELCFEEWRGALGNRGRAYETEGVARCGGPSNGDTDRIVAFFQPGAEFGSEGAGSSDTAAPSSLGVEKYFRAEVSAEDFGAAVAAVDTRCVRQSAPPSKWTLAGVVSGMELFDPSSGRVTTEEPFGPTVSTIYSLHPVEISAVTAVPAPRQADVTATVDGNGACTSYGVQYGPTTSYGAEASNRELGEPLYRYGIGNAEERVTLTGLEPATLYHYRIVARRLRGCRELEEGYGQEEEEFESPDMTFTIPAERPSVTTGAVSSLTDTSTTLHATVNPNGSTVSACYFEYGPSLTYGSTIPCVPAPGSGDDPVEVSASLAGLNMSTTYHYRIVAINAVGESQGTDLTFSTPPYRPYVFTGFASSITETAATLSARIDPKGTTVSSCYFEYGTTEHYGSVAQCAALPGSGEETVEVSARAEHLTKSAVYYYRIVAVNAVGASYGGPESFETRPFRPHIELTHISEQTETSAVLNARVNPEGTLVTACTFEFGPTTAYGTAVPCLPAPGSGESPVEVQASAQRLAKGDVYHYRIVATNSGGTSVSEDREFRTMSVATCWGAPITGQGSTLQRVAQNVWNSGFNTSGDEYACDGRQGSRDTPTVTYDVSSDGAGLRSWGADGLQAAENPFVGFGTNNAFIATDEPPSAGEIQNIEEETEGYHLAYKEPLVPESIETIPVAQEAIAIVVNLPEGCTANSTGAPGRLVLSDAALQGIFAGTVKQWGQLSEGGDTISGPGCGGDHITPIVPDEESGETHILKRFLGGIYQGSLSVAPSGTASWDELSEGPDSMLWPAAAEVQTPGYAGTGSAQANKVLDTPGSIGFVNLAEARASFGKPTARAFWVKLQNRAGRFLSYSEPSTDEDTPTVANANCEKTQYLNGNIEKTMPGSVTEGSWNEVTAVPNQRDYALCGLTYDVVFAEYSLELPGTSIDEGETVGQYLEYVTDKKGGQRELSGHDYYPLPSAIAIRAVAGAKRITWGQWGE